LEKFKFKGIILSGGMGTRLSPVTKILNKQLLPLYDKPIIFYSLSVLMLAKIKNILIIVNPNDLQSYKKLFGDGSRLGLNLKYEIQHKPLGLPEAFKIGEKFISSNPVALILGDNFFYGQGLANRLEQITIGSRGCTVFLYPVVDPSSYGIAKIYKGKIVKIIEKPKKKISNLAITGLYFFDNNVCKFAKKLKPSKRNETEITDIIKMYLKRKKLRYEFLGRGSAWLDTGTFDKLYQASDFVKTIEERQGLKIACIEEIAFKNGWIDKKKFEESIKFYGRCEYSNYLKKIISQ